MKTGNSKCFKCNRIKRKVLFHIDKSRKAGVSSYCKSCKSKLDRLRSSRRGERNEKGDHIYTVYYLPEEHYAGMTKDLLRRISSHKKLGKIVDGYSDSFADFIDELETSEKNQNAQCSIDHPECESCSG